MKNPPIRKVRKSKYPNTREGWYHYYAARYNKDQSNWMAENLAVWFLIMLEAFGEYPGKEMK